MSNTKGTHWYDGWFYEKFIAKHVDDFIPIIESLIEGNKDILDVGCGTGRMSLHLAEKCKSVTGIDLSVDNISIANNKLEDLKVENITFVAENVTQYLNPTLHKFDYAILSFVIHEIPLEERKGVIEAVKKVADRIIFADYTYPELKGFKGMLNRVVEYAAGREHYEGFKSYIGGKGLKGIIKQNNLNVLNEIIEENETHHIVVASVK